MDEGQYLQDVYRSDPEFGGAGWYGFDSRAHLTEASDVLTADNIVKLRESWHAHWDNRKSICLEKTPGERDFYRRRFLMLTSCDQTASSPRQYCHPKAEHELTAPSF